MADRPRELSDVPAAIGTVVTAPYRPFERAVAVTCYQVLPAWDGGERAGGERRDLHKRGGGDPPATLCGGGPNDILTLRWDYVPLEPSRLRLRDSGAGLRSVPLSAAAARILARVSRIPGNPWVVPSRNPGAPLSGIFLQWRRARRHAGLNDVRLHDLHHSFTSRALAFGESLHATVRLFRHARVEATSRCGHLARDTVKEAAARVAAGTGGVRAAAKRITERIGADILPR